MTDDEVRSARALAEAASDGPWHACGFDQSEDGALICELSLEDASLCAASRTLVPHLCDEVESLRADMDAVRGLLAVLNRDGGHFAAEHGIAEACENGKRQYYDLLRTVCALQEKLDQARKRDGK